LREEIPSRKALKNIGKLEDRSRDQSCSYLKNTLKESNKRKRAHTHMLRRSSLKNQNFHQKIRKIALLAEVLTEKI
jgi:hypothetical protein